MCIVFASIFVLVMLILVVMCVCVCCVYIVGHGKSGGERVHVEDLSVYVKDIVSHVKDMKAQHPGLPCFIMGHSMVSNMCGTCVCMYNGNSKVSYFFGVMSHVTTLFCSKLFQYFYLVCIYNVVFES